jgi:tetratricopeptide (TPR) repeat protein
MEEQQLPNWLQQILKQKDRIFYGAMALVLVLVVGYRLAGSRSFKRQGDYAKAAHASEQILAGAKETEALGNLQAALKKHSDLRSRYDGAVAQKLLEQEEVASAMPYAKRALKRTEERAGPYHQFAKGSLLIAENRFEEALSASLALQEQIEGGQNYLLHAYNTLRIAMLEEELGADAKGHWKELLGWIDNSAPEGSEERAAVQQFLQAYQAGGVTMKDFAKVHLND